jgi:CBS domain-containing protein
MKDSSSEPRPRCKQPPSIADLVVDHGRVVGVVTRRHLRVPTPQDDPSGSLTLMPGKHLSRLDGLRIRDLMSDEPVCAEPDWPLVQAVRTMIDYGVNRLPVVDPTDRPLGVLTRDDVLGAWAAATRPAAGSARRQRE